MIVNNCQICGRNQAFLRNRNSGVMMCLYCFSKTFERQFERSIKKEGKLRPVGRVLVAVSGSVSSLVLSSLLEDAEMEFPYVKLVFVHLRRWRDGTEEERVTDHIRKRLTKELEVFPIENLLGVPNFETIIRDATVSRELSCTVCKALTRRALFRAAKRLDAQYIALGETLDEYLADKLIELWLMGRSKSLNAIFREKTPERIRISRPLLFATTEDVERYSRAKGLFENGFMCPYRDQAKHSIMRSLRTMEERSPGVLSSFRQALLTYDRDNEAVER